MLTRRAFGAGLAATALGALPCRGAAGGAQDTIHAALLDRIAALLLERAPEESTAAGFDVGAHAGLRAKLGNRSPQARAEELGAIRQAQGWLAAVDPATLAPSIRLDHEVARFVCDTLAEIRHWPGYIDLNLRPSPYVVSQMNGAYYWLPGLFGAGHPLATNADAEAWLLRLSALADVLDEETASIRADAGRGFVPPGFVIARTVAQITALRDRPALQNPFIAPALTRAAAAGLPDLGPRADAIFTARVIPALDRQADALRGLAAGASNIPGVWRLPDGDAYYAAALRANTTTTTAPADLHRQGLDQCVELASEIDRLLRAQGFTHGSLAARLGALDLDPRFAVSNDDAGRARILSTAGAILDRIRARLPGAFNPGGVRPLTVTRMSTAIEAGSPGAFYTGGDPGVIVLNLGTPAEHPLWRLPTLLHHEGIPGHHLQASILESTPGLPLLRRIVRFSAYTEGWALYAEEVADELGVYENDPFGRIGALQSQLFRAARIVVDTGLHHHRWTLDQAVAWMVEHAGEQPESTRREVVRYSVYPGQACSFRVGAGRIRAAREAARTAMGTRFRVQDFHDLVLRTGPVPMMVLEAAARQWSAA